jgi:hypothetical protein
VIFSDRQGAGKRRADVLRLAMALALSTIRYSAFYFSAQRRFAFTSFDSYVRT